MFNVGESIALGTLSIGASSVLITMIKSRHNGKYVTESVCNIREKAVESSLTEINRKVDLLVSHMLK